MQRREWDELVRWRPHRPSRRRPALAVLAVGGALALGAVVTGSEPGGLDPSPPGTALAPDRGAPPVAGPEAAPPPPVVPSAPGVPVPTTAVAPAGRVTTTVVPAAAPEVPVAPPPTTPPPVTAPPTVVPPPTVPPVPPTTLAPPGRTSWVPGLSFPAGSNRRTDAPNEQAKANAARGRGRR